MAKASPIYTGFNNGEVSPYMYARVDTDKYGLSLRECTNFIPLVQGALTKRGGTHFAASVADEAKKSRLLKFEFNPEQAYAVEVNDDRIRFFTLRGLLVELPKAVTSVSGANPAVVTVTAHGFLNSEQVVFPAIGSLAALHQLVFTVANKTNDTFELTGFDGGALPALSGTVTVARVYAVTSPYEEDELGTLYSIQSADVLYIFHKNHPPKQLVRSGSVAWGISDFTFNDGPYLTQNATTTTLTPSGTTGSITLTASSIVGINGGTGFQTTDINRVVRIQDSAGNWTWGRITARTSTTVVTVSILGPNLPNTNARSTWRLGLYSDTTGWPSCGTFFKDRMLLSGPPSHPYFIAGSESGLYDRFAPTAVDGTVTAANGFAYALVSRQVNVMNWMLETERGLLIGTPAGEAVVSKAVAAEPFSALNIEVTWPTSYGSAQVAPVQAENAALFIQRAGKRLREYAFVFEADNFRAANLSVMADHILEAGADRMAYQKHPQGLMWFRRIDGRLVGFSYEREQNVFAWHSHPLGGSAVEVEDVIAMSAPDGGAEDVWLIVKRSVNGVTRRYVEFFGKFFGHSTAQSNAIFSDSAYVYTGSPTVEPFGFGHLEGEDVRVLADGVDLGLLSVADGKIALPFAASVVIAGSPYVARMWTLPYNAGAQDGTAQGKLKRIARLVLRLYRALGGKYGPAVGNKNTIEYRSIEVGINEPQPLFSGDTGFLPFPGGWEQDGGFVIENDSANPFTLLAAMPRGETQDGG